MNTVNRNIYLERIKQRMHNGLVKIITGPRRSGKSWLLRQIFTKYLLSIGVEESQIIHISLDIDDENNQTDLLQAAAATGRIVNIKKGQFMAPWDMRGAIAKCREINASNPIWLTERGSSFGYGNIVVDMTSLVRMREYGCPVVFDATHSVQQPSSQQGVTGGNRELVPPLMRAALAVGVVSTVVGTVAGNYIYDRWFKKK